MKKNYFLFQLFLGVLLCLPLQAREVVTDIGTMVTQLSQIKAGDKLLFFCNGPIDQADKEYGLRQSFVMEGDDHQLYMTRGLKENTVASCDFIWTVLSYDAVEGDEFSYKMTLQSPRGNHLPAFKEQSGKRPRWPGVTVDPEEPAAEYTVTVSNSGDSLYYIMDTNGVFFNGQSIPVGDYNSTAKFVGWNSTGANSLYKIFLPIVEEKDSYHITMVLNDEEGEKQEDGTVEIDALMGDTIRAPQWQYHNFVGAIDDDTEKEVLFPYVVDGSEPFLLLKYESWPYIIVNCTDEATGEAIYVTEQYIKKGDLFPLPTKEDVGIGYTLVTTGYDDYVITKDETINLVYRKDGKALPFVATTVENGQFAADTKWYVLKINGDKVLAFDSVSLGVNCGDVAEYNDAHLWTFVGDLDKGYKIYNKQAGPDMVLWAPDGENKTQVFLTEEEQTTEPNTFDINFNGSGFSWKLHGTDMSYLNDLGGFGILKFWKHVNSATGNGSRFTFREYTEQLGNALVFGKYISYLQTEGCVGGWKAEDLAPLKVAYAQKDTTACREALELLATKDTIAFDAHQRYALVSAYTEFISTQPKSVYAMAAAPDSSLVWKALDENDAAFHFGMKAATDSTFFIVSTSLNLPVGGFRFGGDARCVPWGDVNVTENLVKDGHPAPFAIVKNTTAPASYYLVHNYGPSIITLSCNPHQNAAATSGKIDTYNTKNGEFNNYWRLLPLGEWDGIDAAVMVPVRGQQVIYDLSGRRVQRMVKGLYIVNGKKVYVK